MEIIMIKRMDRTISKAAFHDWINEFLYEKYKRNLKFDPIVTLDSKFIHDLAECLYEKLIEKFD